MTNMRKSKRKRNVEKTDLEVSELVGKIMDSIQPHVVSVVKDWLARNPRLEKCKWEKHSWVMEKASKKPVKHTICDKCNETMNCKGFVSCKNCEFDVCLECKHLYNIQ